MENYEHYSSDVDVMRVAYSAASSFRGVLTQDEIRSCVLNAILRAIKKYDKNNTTKFTSFLHNGVVFECLNQKKLNTNNRTTKQLHPNIKDNNNIFESIDVKDLIESVCDDPSLIFDRFYGNMTIKEMSKQRNVCRETIKVRLTKNLEKLRSELRKSVL